MRAPDILLWLKPTNIRKLPDYFTLQLGCVFSLAVVSAFCCEPSASIVQIWLRPLRLD